MHPLKKKQTYNKKNQKNTPPPKKKNKRQQTTSTKNVMPIQKRLVLLLEKNQPRKNGSCNNEALRVWK